MGVVYSLAEALNIVWGSATDDAKASVKARVQDAAFRRKIAKALSAQLDGVEGVDAKVLKRLLKDPDFLAFVVNPLDGDLRSRVDDGRLEELLGPDQSPEQLELLARNLAMVVEAAIAGSATHEDRLLLARIGDVSRTQVETVRIVLDLHTRLDTMTTDIVEALRAQASGEAFADLPEASWQGDPPMPYEFVLRRVLAEYPRCRSRTPDLARIRQGIATGRRPNAVVTASPYSGKSTLAAHIARSWRRLNGKRLVVVCFFVRAKDGHTSSDNFLYAINSQLMIYTGTPGGIPTDGDRARLQLTHLWELAGQHAERQGDLLLLMVDGLDEERSPGEIGRLIPPGDSSARRTLILSRYNATELNGLQVLDAVRQDTILAHELAPTKFTVGDAGGTKRELAEILHSSDGSLEPILASITVARAPLSAIELSDAIGEPLYRVEHQLATLGRHLVSSTDGWVFRHVEALRSAEHLLGQQSLRERRLHLLDWARYWALRSWPDDTPTYLRRHLGRLLETLDDPVTLDGWISFDRLRLIDGDQLATIEAVAELRRLRMLVQSTTGAGPYGGVLASVGLKSAFLQHSAGNMGPDSWREFALCVGPVYAFSRWLRARPSTDIWELLAIAEAANGDDRRRLVDVARPLTAGLPMPDRIAADIHCALLTATPEFRLLVSIFGPHELLRRTAASLVKDNQMMAEFIDTLEFAGLCQGLVRASVRIGIVGSLSDSEIALLEGEADYYSVDEILSLIAVAKQLEAPLAASARDRVLREAELCLQSHDDAYETAVASYIETVAASYVDPAGTPVDIVLELLDSLTEAVSLLRAATGVARLASQLAEHDLDLSAACASAAHAVVANRRNLGSLWSLEALIATAHASNTAGLPELGRNALELAGSMFESYAQLPLDSPATAVALARSAAFAGASDCAEWYERALRSLDGEMGSVYRARLMSQLLGAAPDRESLRLLADRIAAMLGASCASGDLTTYRHSVGHFATALHAVGLHDDAIHATRSAMEVGNVRGPGSMLSPPLLVARLLGGELTDDERSILADAVISPPTRDIGVQWFRALALMDLQSAELAARTSSSTPWTYAELNPDSALLDLALMHASRALVDDSEPSRRKAWSLLTEVSPPSDHESLAEYVECALVISGVGGFQYLVRSIPELAGT